MIVTINTIPATMNPKVSSALQQQSNSRRLFVFWVLVSSLT